MRLQLLVSGCLRVLVALFPVQPSTKQHIFLCSVLCVPAFFSLYFLCRTVDTLLIQICVFVCGALCSTEPQASYLEKKKHEQHFDG